MQCQKAVWSIPYVSVALFPSLKQNFIAYRSSKVSSRLDYIFEIHLLWQWGFSRVYSNSCCSCSFEPEIKEIGQSYHKMYSNNIQNFQESTIILNACTKKRLETYWRHHVNRYGVYSICLLTFFVQAFKIAVESWRFSMLLLYILWDDWPIFMLSGSN